MLLRLNFLALCASDKIFSCLAKTLQLVGRAVFSVGLLMIIRSDGNYLTIGQIAKVYLPYGTILPGLF